MKEQILELRSQGKTSTQIANELGCNKSMITYYTSEESRAKKKEKQSTLETRFLIKRVDKFKTKRIADRSKDFQRRVANSSGSELLKTSEKNFGYKDVLDKHGITTKCYLSGVELNLMEDKEFQFDHIVPPGKGGTNSLDNLGITHRIANMMKQDLTKEELFEWCKKILEYNGYVVTKGE